MGLTLGVAGVLVVPHGRIRICTPAAAIAAVLLGTMVARMAGLGIGRFSPGELIVQIVFGLCAVVLVAAVADRRSSRHKSRDDAAGAGPGRRR
ncbi:GlsB/YeaQ/YmgE family stress response membrane protein [Actinoplanes auranticolor]|uniref:GlsB/YeaQ/YmgE family stress response membrane protein n=1 Tax=Actinoplanes auranticolor TaxID=47988 RepID=UPI001FE6242E|nr:GlsB/YeaQ/YmgE family stress response membrane protein [Actinoplanes auranticolor]